MNQITVIGFGTQESDLTLGASELLKSGRNILLRTARCACAAWLDGQDIPYTSLDALYEQAEDFDRLNDMIVEALFCRAEKEEVLYGVADIRDASVSLLLKRAAERVLLIPGVPVDAPLTAYLPEVYTMLPAVDCERFQPDSSTATLIREIDSRALASEIKLKLMQRYPDGAQIKILSANGAVVNCPLTELDRQTFYNHRVSALIPAVSDVIALERYGFDDLNRIVKRLRGPGGCPWDIKQTHESLCTNIIEEAYEVVDAIYAGDMDALYDELGDVLLQVSLHAEIARQHGEFGVDDVTTAVCRKMITRHPHIFGEAHADTAEDVLTLWENVKKSEKRLSTQGEGMLAVTKALPALMRAEKVQKKAAAVGFDWDCALDALNKVFEEAQEVREAIAGAQNYAEELGDLLFAVVNVARLMKVQPEEALMSAVDKFIGRFEAMEKLIAADGLDMNGMTLEEMDVYWNRVKAYTM